MTTTTDRLAGREELLGLADTLESRTVPVPGLDAPVRVLEMSGGLRDLWNARVLEHVGEGEDISGWPGWRTWLVAASVVDAAGRPLFDPDNGADIAAVYRIPRGARMAIAAEALELNGLTRGSVDAMEKGSGGTTSGASGSASPGTSGGPSGSSGGG